MDTKSSVNRLLMVQKMVVFSSISVFSIMNVKLVGGWMGGSRCRMSIIRSGNVALSNLRNGCVALSILRNGRVTLSNLRNGRVACR